MMETSLRRVRIMDVGIAAGLQQGTAFFADMKKFFQVLSISDDKAAKYYPSPLCGLFTKACPPIHWKIYL